MTIFYFVTQAAGGVTSVGQLTNLSEEYLFDLNGAVPFAVLLGVSLSGPSNIVDPRQLSRFYGLKSDAEVKRGMWIAVLGMTLILACMFPIGLYAHLILENVTDTDLIIPAVNDPAIFPFWVTDLLIVSIVSAAMSSMDSVLLVASSTLYKNIIAPFKTVENEVRWSRAAVIAFACISAFMALNPPGDIVGITIFSGACTAFASSHRWFWPLRSRCVCKDYAGINDSGDEYADTLDYLGSKRPAPRGLPRATRIRIGLLAAIE